jgi:hypothetical protein
MGRITFGSTGVSIKTSGLVDTSGISGKGDLDLSSVGADDLMMLVRATLMLPVSKHKH